jgi:hypothetical protein
VRVCLITDRFNALLRDLIERCSETSLKSGKHGNHAFLWSISCALIVGRFDVGDYFYWAFA